jgi:hypothetical protein
MGKITDPYTKRIITIVYVVGLLYVIISGIVSFNYDRERKSNLIHVTYDMKVDTLEVDSGNDRGGIFLKDKLVILSYCPVIDEPEGFDGWYSINAKLASGKPYIKGLSDLKVPYLLYKNAYSDTIFVFSKGYTLKFLLMETPEEHTRYLDSLYKTMD